MGLLPLAAAGPGAAFAARLPPCLFRAVTGYPCGGCGTTRALLALGGFDLSAAFRLNPLTTVASLAFLAGGVGAGLLALSGREVCEPRSLPWWLLALLVLAVALNWAWLVADGR